MGWWVRMDVTGCGKTRCGTFCSAGILPASDESKGVAGWKPALRPPPKEFFRSLLRPEIPNIFRTWGFVRARTSLPPELAKRFAVLRSVRKRALLTYVTGERSRRRWRAPPSTTGVILLTITWEDEFLCLLENQLSPRGLLR